MKHDARVVTRTMDGTSKHDRGRVVEDAWAVCPCSWRTHDGKPRSVLRRDTEVVAQLKADEHNKEAS